MTPTLWLGFRYGSDGKDCLQCRRPRFDPWIRKIPCRRKWHPTPVFLLGNPMDRGAWWVIVRGGRKELDTTERLTEWPTLYLLRNSPMPGTYQLLWSNMRDLSHIKENILANSLAVQWLRLCQHFHCQGPRVQFLVRELRLHRLCGLTKNKNKKNILNIEVVSQ